MALPSDYANLVQWFRSDTGLWQDAAKTVAATTTGDKIYTWANSGSGADFIQATSGSRPVLSTTGGANGKPRVTVNNQKMKALQTSIAQPHTLFIVGTLTGMSGTGYAVWWWSGVGDIQITTPSTGGGLTNYFYANSSVINGTIPCVSGTPHLQTAIFNGASSQLWFNTTSSVTGNPGSKALVDVTIGGDYNGSGHYLIGDFYEIILYNSALTTAQRLAITGYLGAKYDLPFINPGTAPQGQKSKYTAAYSMRGFVLGDQRFNIENLKSSTEGDPGSPCLSIGRPNSYKFRWVVSAGTRTISVKAKQVSNVAGMRPRMIIRSNASIGVASDVVTDAGAGTGWVTIGPATVTPTLAGVLDVELWNMDAATLQSPAFFDHLVAT